MATTKQMKYMQSLSKVSFAVSVIIFIALPMSVIWYESLITQGVLAFDEHSPFNWWVLGAITIGMISIVTAAASRIWLINKSH